MSSGMEVPIPKRIAPATEPERTGSSVWMPLVRYVKAMEEPIKAREEMTNKTMIFLRLQAMDSFSASSFSSSFGWKIKVRIYKMKMRMDMALMSPSINCASFGAKKA